MLYENETLYKNLLENTIENLLVIEKQLFKDHKVKDAENVGLIIDDLKDLLDNYNY